MYCNYAVDVDVICAFGTCIFPDRISTGIVTRGGVFPGRPYADTKAELITMVNESPGSLPASPKYVWGELHHKHGSLQLNYNGHNASNISAAVSSCGRLCLILHKTSKRSPPFIHECELGIKIGGIELDKGADEQSEDKDKTQYWFGEKKATPAYFPSRAGMVVLRGVPAGMI